MARYAAVVCGGDTPEQLTNFALKVRAASPQTQIIMFAHFGPHETLTELGVQLLRPPVNVNTLVERLRPLVA